MKVECSEKDRDREKSRIPRYTVTCTDAPIVLYYQTLPCISSSGQIMVIKEKKKRLMVCAVIFLQVY